MSIKSQEPSSTHRDQVSAAPRSLGADEGFTPTAQQAANPDQHAGATQPPISASGKYFLSGSDASAAEQFAAWVNQAQVLIATWSKDKTLFSGADHKHIQNTFSKLTPHDEPIQSDQIQRYWEQFLQHSVNPNQPQCAAHLHCPVLGVAAASELICAAANQSMDSWDQAPAGTVIEEQLINWFATRIGFDKQAGGVMTSGGTQSNLMGLMLARDHYAMSQLGVSIQEQGLPQQLSRARILCGEDAHFSLKKNAAVLGLGFASIQTIATDAAGAMCPIDLQNQLENLSQRNQPVIAVVATAGYTDTGAIDPLGPIAKLCQRYRVWLHVDAAWGGALLLSKQFSNRLRGLNLADSVTLDFHKHFFQPISCSGFFLKNAAHFSLMHLNADYLNSERDQQHQVTHLVGRSLQTTRRCDALKLAVSLRYLGLEQYSQLIERPLKLALDCAHLIALDPALELHRQPQLSSVLFGIRSDFLTQPWQLDGIDPETFELGRSSTKTAASSTGQGHEQNLHEFYHNLSGALLQSGQLNLGVTRLRGRPWLKLTLLNPQSSSAELGQMLSAVKAEALQLSKKNRGLRAAITKSSVSSTF